MSLVELSAKIVNDNVILKSADLAGMVDNDYKDDFVLELGDIKKGKESNKGSKKGNSKEQSSKAKSKENEKGKKKGRGKKGFKIKESVTTSTTSTTTMSMTTSSTTTTSTSIPNSISTTSDASYNDYTVSTSQYIYDVAYEAAYPDAFKNYDYSSYVEIDHEAFAEDLHQVKKSSKKHKTSKHKAPKVKKTTTSTRKTPAFTVATLKMAADNSEIIDEGSCKSLPAWLSPGNCVFPVEASSVCEPECAFGFEKKLNRDGNKKASCDCDGDRCKFETQFKCVPACDRNVLEETPVGLVPKCKFPISG